MTYAKDDVQFHSDHGWSSRPAVNVKTEPWKWEDGIADAMGYEDFDGRFPDWYREAAEADGFLDRYWAFACEAGWEQLQTEAEHYFGSGVSVYAEGRSGGWAVVDGLPDVESWDAVALAKWRGFEKSARIIAAGIPADMAILAAMNGFESWLATQPSLATQMLAGSGVGL
jgi:hypothetical protein